jgi:hypothetical protein
MPSDPPSRRWLTSWAIKAGIVAMVKAVSGGADG